MDTSRIATLATAILAELGQQTATPHIRQPDEEGSVLDATEPSPTAPDDRIFTRDYYVRGQLSALKGASLKAYNDSLVALGYTRNADIPLHYSVQCPAPYPVAVAALASIADVGWSNGEAYRYDRNASPGQNYARWIDAGCPHRTSDGTAYGSAGQPVDPRAWAELYDKYIARARPG
jgi:hypothetical protein